MIKVVNLSSQDVDESLIRKAIRVVLKEEKSDLSLSVAVVTSEEIKKLNYQYRKKNSPTDVLSFGEDINEIVICPDEIKKNGDNFDEELEKVVIHGILHLLGYNHEGNKDEAKRMFDKQDKYFKKNGKTKSNIRH